MRNIFSLIFFESESPIGLYSLGIRKKQAQEFSWDMPKILSPEWINNSNLNSNYRI